MRGTKISREHRLETGASFVLQTKTFDGGRSTEDTRWQPPAVVTSRRGCRRAVVEQSSGSRRAAVGWRPPNTIIMCKRPLYGRLPASDGDANAAATSPKRARSAEQLAMRPSPSSPFDNAAVHMASGSLDIGDASTASIQVRDEQTSARRRVGRRSEASTSIALMVAATGAARRASYRAVSGRERWQRWRWADA